MARVRNDVFQGAAISDVDPDAVTYRRVIQAAIGDTALVEDVLTGEHSPPASSVITHAGKEGDLWRGCPLGAPLVQIAWPFYEDGSYPQRMLYSSGTSAFAIVVPFYLPRGETVVAVHLHTDNETQLTAEVYDASMTLVSRGFLSVRETGVMATRVAGLVGGTLYVFALRVPRNLTETGVRGLFIGFERQTRSPLLAAPGAGEAFTVPTTPVSPDVGTGIGAVMDLTAFDEALVADGRAISSYHLTRLNQTQNALEEHLTGAPAAGNLALALIDTNLGAPNPSKSAFHDHARSSVKPLEGLVDFPVWADAWGGIAPDGQGATFAAAWEAPAAIGDTITFNPFARAMFIAPPTTDQDGVTATRLRVVLIGCSPDDEDVDGAGGIDLEGGDAITADFVRMGSTRFWLSEIEVLEYTPNVVNTAELSARFVDTGRGTGYFRILGGCAYTLGT